MKKGYSVFYYPSIGHIYEWQTDDGTVNFFKTPEDAFEFITATVADSRPYNSFVVLMVFRKNTEYNDKKYKAK